MPGRVERQPTGWYAINKELHVPMLMDIYRAGGFADSYRQLLRRAEDLERR